MLICLQHKNKINVSFPKVTLHQNVSKNLQVHVFFKSAYKTREYAVRISQIAVTENLLDECLIPALKPWMKVLTVAKPAHISEISLDLSFHLATIFSPRNSISITIARVILHLPAALSRP